MHATEQQREQPVVCPDVEQHAWRHSLTEKRGDLRRVLAVGKVHLEIVAGVRRNHERHVPLDVHGDRRPVRREPCRGAIAGRRERLIPRANAVAAGNGTAARVQDRRTLRVKDVIGTGGC